uniref:hypothetical protein n=1 Tax=Aminobacter niigataensis TaxID=83265 RepID=UPI0028525764|nr:hypothetical protein [Aminobacter niigataensis]WMD00116.1 hypothetical protein RAR13_28965 [Aminobacter niigataensis]
MSSQALHLQKADMFNALLDKYAGSNGNPFIAINLAMYTLGHYIEALLAERGRHPGAAMRGVPHADRGALMRSVLVAEGVLAEGDASLYGQLVLDRDTFIDGGIPDQAKLAAYVDTARPLITKLRTLVSGN